MAKDHLKRLGRYAEIDQTLSTTTTDIVGTRVLHSMAGPFVFLPNDDTGLLPDQRDNPTFRVHLSCCFSSTYGNHPETDSDEPIEVSWQELIDFAVGEATEEVSKRVKRALGDSNHPLYYLTQRGARTRALPENGDAN